MAWKECISVATSLLVFFACACSAQYLRTYPPKQNDTVPLYFALMQSFGGGFNGSGVIGGVEVALDQINDDPTLLPGYTLHYTLTDSQVRSLYSVHQGLPILPHSESEVAIHN